MKTHILHTNYKNKTLIKIKSFKSSHFIHLLQISPFLASLVTGSSYPRKTPPVSVKIYIVMSYFKLIENIILSIQIA